MVFCLLLGSSAAYATTLSGQVQEIRADALSGPARISIKLAGDTACQTHGWFAFDNADTGIGKIWTDIALSAYGRHNPLATSAARSKSSSCRR